MLITAKNEYANTVLLTGCVHEGVYRESGSQWRDPKRPCKSFTCKSGVVTETDEVCYTPCAQPRPPTEGQCCRTCKGTYIVIVVTQTVLPYVSGPVGWCTASRIPLSYESLAVTHAVFSSPSSTLVTAWRDLFSKPTIGDCARFIIHANRTQVVP